MFDKSIKVRNVNIELVRIICMCMVVYGHSLLSLDFMNSEDILCKNISYFIFALVCVAVNCYFLITGYFGANSDFSSKKIISIWAKTLFYSILISIIYFLYQIASENIVNYKILILYTFPVFLKHYWFIQVYIVILLIKPFFNIVLRNISFSQFNYLLLVGFIFFSLHESFFRAESTLDSTAGYGICWATYMYFCGAYINKYQQLFPKFIKSFFFNISNYLFICFLIFISGILIVKFNIGEGEHSRTRFYGYNSVSIFAASLSFFVAFINIKFQFFKEVKSCIFYLSNSALSVYLITAHPLIFTALWTDVFDNSYLHNGVFVYIKIFIEMIVFYLLCTLFDVTRRMFVQKIIVQKFSVLCNIIDSHIKF